MSDLNNNRVQDKSDLKQSASGADVSGVLSNQALDEMIRANKAAAGAAAGAVEHSINGVNGANSGSSDSGAIVHSVINGHKSENGNKPQEHDRCPEVMNQLHGKHQFELMKRPLKDGVSDMGTGDKLVKDGDREILFMPNGDKLTVNKDGSFDLKTNGPVEVKKQGDTTTIIYPNGDSVSFGKKGVESVTRGNLTVDVLDRDMLNFPPNMIPRPPIELPHPNPGQGGGGGAGGRPPYEWDGGLKNKK